MQQNARTAVSGQQKNLIASRSAWGLSQPVRAPGAQHTASHSIAGAAVQAAPLRHVVKQRHCCCLAAVPPSGSPADPQQPPAAALWSEEDIFEAYDLPDVPSASSSSGDDAPPNPEQLPGVLAAAGSSELPPEPHHQQQQPLTVLPLHSRHQRRFSQQLGAAVQQQQQQQQQQHQQQHQHTQPSGLQQLQTLVRSFDHVHLLHRIASTNSWTAATAVLQEEHSSLQADHVGLLWRQLLPKLQAQQQAAADRARREGPAQQRRSDSQPQRLQQQVQMQVGVLQELVRLTGRFACSMAPQSLLATLQGLAAAAAAGKVVAATGEGVAAPLHTQVVQLDRQVLQALQQQLVQVAGSCSPQELAACLTSGQQLGWCDQQHPSAGTSSSSGNQGPCQCCWSVLHEASKGPLGVLLSSGALTRFAAAHLLHGLAGCTHAAAAGSSEAVLTPQLELPSAQQQQVPGSAVGTDSILVQQLVHRALLVATPAQPAGAVTDAALGAAVCSLQAAALLQHMPDVDCLEQLLADLQPHLAAGRLGAQQQLAVLQSCHELGVEPWPEWLQDCYRNLAANGLQDLQPQQLLQLLHVLQATTNLQPSHVLLHQLAKMTAVHCSRYSCQQLAGLPSALQQLGFRPQPYWLKDYIAASGALLTAEQQEQQVPCVASAAVLAEMLSGVGWLSAAPPPRAWLQIMEQALLAAAATEAPQQLQQQHYGQHVPTQSQQQLRDCHSSSRQHGQSSGRLPAGCAAVVARVLGQWGYTPGKQLQQVLSASLQDSHSTGPGGGAGDGDSSSAHAPAATAAAATAAADVSQQQQLPGRAVTVEHHMMHQLLEPAPGPHSFAAAAGHWEIEQLLDADRGLGQVQESRGFASPAGQLARLASASQGRSKPAVRNRLWYRSKLLQLVRGQQHSSSPDSPALAVL